MKIIDVNIKEIDDYIKDIIIMLNDIGLKTLYSCSGIKEDHIYEGKNMGMDGYILFEETNKENEHIIKTIANNTYLSVEMPKNKEVIYRESIDSPIKHKIVYDPRCCMRINRKTKTLPNDQNFQFTADIDQSVKKQWDKLRKELISRKK